MSVTWHVWSELIAAVRANVPARLDAIAPAFVEVVRALRGFQLAGKTKHTQRIAHRAAWEMLQALDDVGDMVQSADEERMRVGLAALERGLRALTTLLDLAALEIMA